MPNIVRQAERVAPGQSAGVRAFIDRNHRSLGGLINRHRNKGFMLDAGAPMNGIGSNHKLRCCQGPAGDLNAFSDRVHFSLPTLLSLRIDQVIRLLRSTWSIDRCHADRSGGACRQDCDNH